MMSEIKSNKIQQRIQRLPIQLANQIAAGEVVERPASVVKEILENAIDAKADKIEIEIIDGGKKLIRITDNGAGINKEDLPLAVSRHATSKLLTIEQLTHINSLGFRGEALASISSVSRLSIHSRQRLSNSTLAEKAWSIDTSSDTEFTNYDAEIKPSALQQGTTVEIRDLFYNTPARRKFLRADKTEFRYIEEIFKRIALSHFNITFSLIHNKKRIKKLPTIILLSSNVKESDVKTDYGSRIKKIFNSDFYEELIEVNENSQVFQDLGQLKLTGWVAKPTYQRMKNDQQFFYVNGRYIKDKLLSHALRQAYHEVLPSEQHSAYILYLTIKPEYVDVNVHPTKHEVRFQQSRMVHDFVVSSVVRTLSGSRESENEKSRFSDKILENPFHQNPLYKNVVGEKKYVPSIPNRDTKINEQNENYQKFFSSKCSLLSEDISSNVPLEQALPSVKNILSEHDPLYFTGELLTLIDFVLLAKQDTLLYLVNCNKVTQKVNYNILRQQVHTKKLLIPISIVCKLTDIELILDYQQKLLSLGLEFNQSGPEHILLRSVAKTSFKIDYIKGINFLIDALRMYKNKQWNDSMNETLIKAISNATIENQSLNRDQQLLIMNFVLNPQFDSHTQGNNQGNNQGEHKSLYKIINSKELNNLI